MATQSSAFRVRCPAHDSFFVYPTTPSRPRGPRAHTRFDLSIAPPVVKPLARARRRATHLAAPRNEPPSNMSLPHRLAQADKPHRTRAASKPRPSVSNPTNTIAATPSVHLHHRQARASSDAPTKRPHGAQAIGTKLRRVGLSEFSATAVGEKPGRNPSTSTQIRTETYPLGGSNEPAPYALFASTAIYSATANTPSSTICLSLKE